MLKSSFSLPNGTIVTIEGSVKDVQSLLSYYAESIKENPTNQPYVADSNISIDPLIEKKSRPIEGDILHIIEIIKTCDKAEEIEKYILDQTNEANRVLLPLFIYSEYLNNTFGLTTPEISRITVDLGVKVSRQNVLRALKYSSPGFVMKVGNPPRYSINRRGISYIKSVLEGTGSLIGESAVTTRKLTPNKRKLSKKISTQKKGPLLLVTELKEVGFFKDKKPLSEVQRKLEEMGYKFAQPALSPCLLKLVRNASLKREKEDDIWYYINN